MDQERALFVCSGQSNRNSCLVVLRDKNFLIWAKKRSDLFQKLNRGRAEFSITVVGMKIILCSNKSNRDGDCVSFSFMTISYFW
jgi:hypothetical protein